MLKSKRDESIKRYLSKICTDKRNSTYTASKYYSINFNENLKIIVRFSDHFRKKDSKEVDIEIIKVSDFYTLRVINAGISYTLEENVILPYLKSILLVYPELVRALTCFKVSSKKAINNANTMYNKLVIVEKKLNYKDEYIEMVDAIYEENKKLKIDITNLNNTISILKTKIEEFKKEVAKTKDILNRVRNLVTVK